MHITEMHVPIDTFDTDRKTKIRAVAALIRMDATDLIPILFAPITAVAAKGCETGSPGKRRDHRR